MSVLNQELPYTYLKDDNKNPEPIRLEIKGAFDKIDEKLINNPGHFERITAYQNGLIVSEKMIPGQHIFSFNKSFTVISPGVLHF